MIKKRLITKSSGEKEFFNIKKLEKSLKKAGIPAKKIPTIAHKILEKKPRTTHGIHTIATKILKKEIPKSADLYNLKHALLEFGPDGFPFELFVAQLFAAEGYKVQPNQIIAGKCVEHEIDVVVEKNKHHSIVEAKFHNKTNYKSDVKVALYIQARFDDIKPLWDKKHPNHTLHQAWIVTNTKFTSKAKQYAACKKLKLISWNYPHKDNLADLIQKHQLYPVTTLTSLTKKQKRTFLKKGFVLCRDAQKQKKLLTSLGLSAKRINQIIKESQALCTI